jgi:hypothetical protein
MLFVGGCLIYALLVMARVVCEDQLQDLRGLRLLQIFR